MLDVICYKFKDLKKSLFAVLCVVALAACNSATTMNNKANNAVNPEIENIMTRVSVREFTGEFISQEQIDTLLRATMAAPSALNHQPWAFIVVTDRAVLDQIGEQLPYSRCANKPACAIIPCGDLTKAIEGEGQNFWINDVSAATENLLLAAHAMGLGAVWTGIHPGQERINILKEILALPEHIIPLCVVPIGVPAEQPEVKNKYKEENIHYNKW